MRVSIAKIKANPLSALDFSLTEDVSADSYGYRDFSVSGPLTVSGRLQNSGDGSFSADLSWSGEIVQQCGRCGKPFSTPVEGRAETRFTLADRADADGEDQLWPIREDQADLAEAVLNEIWFRCPMQPLCRPDCRGLCPVCGVDLNQQSCSCGKDDIDPRWEKLKNLKFEH